MSRAPAPMTLEASPAPMPANPYGMGTFSAMPHHMMPQYPMNVAAAPMHAMQNMYTSMQQPQPSPNPYGMQPQFVGQQTPSPYGMQPPVVGQQMSHGHPGAQNVSVLDFKPDVLAQHHATQLQQQYNAHMSSIAASTQPTLGLVGPDGRYMPATAATPGGMSPRFTSGPYDAVGSSAAQNGSWGSNGLHSHAPHSDSAYDSLHRGMSENGSSSNTNSSSSMASTRAALKDLIDERVPSTRALKNIIEDHVDKAVGRKMASPSVASDFHSKPHEEQRRIVGKAVRSVMEDYDVTPKSKSLNDRAYTSSPYSSRDRGPTSDSRYEFD